LKRIKDCFFQKWNKVGIMWKIFAYVLLFSLLLLSFLWIYQTVLLDRFYKSIKISDLKRSVREVEQNINSDKVSDLLETLAEKKDIGIMVTDFDFTKINIAGKSEYSIIPKLRVSEFFQIYKMALHNGGEAFQSYQIGGKPMNMDKSTHISPSLSEGFVRGEPSGSERRQGASQDLLYAKLITLKDGSQSIIMADTIVTPLDTTVKTLRIQLIQISLIMFFVSLLLAFWVAKIISKPIVKTNNSAKLLASGNYDTIFDSIGYREITQLNDTLNYTASELAKVEKLRRELIANVSHDLRTPLTMIVGYSEIMRDIPGENTPENVQVIIEEAKRLTSLVNGLLDLSKLQSGLADLKEESYNLTGSIKEIISRYQKLTENNGFTIDFVHTGEVYVSCDPLKITQVIYNLINNAINYAGEDKTVTVKQIIQPESVRIEIIDTGDGIDKENLPYIWDRYYKGAKSHKRSVVGTGLGLSIVKSILELHHAQYGVESTTGKGSIFWFELQTI